MAPLGTSLFYVSVYYAAVIVRTKKFIQEGKIGSGFAADDGFALHFIDEELHQVVSSRPDAQGYRVDKEKETKLSTIYLGLEQ